MAEERGSLPKQERSQLLMQVRQVWPGLLLACVVGVAGFGVKLWTNSVYADPLLVAMVLGICTRWLTGNNGKLRPGLLFSYRFFIPIGIVFYGAVKLNFVKFMQVEKSYIALIMLIILVYFLIILGLGRFLKQRKQVTFLTATGSAICGASAIAITSPAVDAESEDISVSLISVFFASAFGLFILLPFLGGLMHLPEQVYAFLAGATLQFTGFVKAAAG
ncbi:MAG: putative sulfate exporter family transporter, partial [Chlorobiales bacterium]|nr:putative sulfate exporter family transporter [Chlorobiales bacterium]